MLKPEEGEASGSAREEDPQPSVARGGAETCLTLLQAERRASDAGTSDEEHGQHDEPLAKVKERSSDHPRIDPVLVVEGTRRDGGSVELDEEVAGKTRPPISRRAH